MANEMAPTEIDQLHITPLAQLLTDTAQEYARDNGMSLSGVMSAIGTATGAMLARAYHNPETAKEVVNRLPIAALAMVDWMHERDPMIRNRKQ